MPQTADRAAIVDWAQALTDALARHDDFQQIAVLIHDPAANGLRLESQRWGAGHDLGLLVPGEWLVPLEGSICGRVFRTGTAALCPDVRLDPDYLSFSGGTTKSELAVPIAVGGRTIGVVNIEAPWASAFGIAELETVRRLIDEAVETFPGGVGRAG